MKQKRIYLVVFLLTITSIFSMNAQVYDDAQMNYLMGFFNYGNNWNVAGLSQDPSGMTSEEKMQFLIDEGIIAVDDKYVEQIKLNASYTGSLQLENFEQLNLLEVKETSLNSFSISNSPLTHLHLEANTLLETISIKDCAELEKVLVTPYFYTDYYEFMSLQKVEVINCQNLNELDLSGINDRPVNNDYLGFHDDFQELKIENCPALTHLNCVSSFLSSIDIDTPGNIKRINAFQCSQFDDFSVFTQLEELTCNIDGEYRTKLPLTLKSFTLSSGYHPTDLDLSFLSSLEVLNIYGTNIYTLKLPESLDLERSDFRYNRLSNEELKKTFGNLTNEAIAKYKIFPQMLNRYKEILSIEEYAEVAEVEAEIDLNAEAYEGGASIFKWYKLGNGVQADLRAHNVFKDGSYYTLIEDWILTGKLEHLMDGPVYTPGDDLDMEHILCIIEPEGYTKWNEVDPRRYYFYQIAPFAELKYQLKIGEELKDYKNGDAIQVDEGEQITLYVECDIDDNPMYYYSWNLYGSIDGGPDIRFPAKGNESKYNWFTELDLSSLTKGKHEILIKYATFETREVVYSGKYYNEKITIEVGVEPGPEPDDPPRLQYKVKIENGTYYNVRTRGTTIEYEGTDVYLGIIPDPSTGDIEYDEWKITYIGPSQEQISTEKKKAEALYEFNPDSPHNKIGDYRYTTTRLHLYKDGREVADSPFTVDDPYTISIVKNNPLPDGIYLQYKVKINDGSYFDVPTHGKTIEKEGTDVRLGIIPVNENAAIAYDEWKISYDSPSADKQSSGNVAAEKLYEFNPDNPHNKTGEYPYLTYRLHLYQGGSEIEGSPYTVNDPYTIIITSDSDNPLMGIPALSTVCPGEKYLRIPYELLSTREKLEYKMVFCEGSDECVFESMKQYEPLPEENYFTITIPDNIPPGTYSGEINVRYSDVPGKIYNYPFQINIPVPVMITKQPEQVLNLCKGDNFNLSVETVGTVLGYQWFMDDTPIKEANAASYSAVFDESTQGRYHVEVTDSCGVVSSDTVPVSGANIWIHLKWDDVLYVYNTQNIYTSFQWYRNGKEITVNGRSGYYTAEDMSGTFTVRAYRADGTYDESCPYEIELDINAHYLNIFPNPVKRNTQLTVKTGKEENAKVQIINLWGKTVYTGRMNGPESQIDVTFPAGVYILVVMQENGNLYTEKMIITE